MWDLTHVEPKDTSGLGHGLVEALLEPLHEERITCPEENWERYGKILRHEFFCRTNSGLKAPAA